MFTLFDAFRLFGACAGLVLGLIGGLKLAGTPGAIGGAIVGSVVGLIVGRLPFILMLRVLSRELAAKTTAELKAHLRSPDCLAPNAVLLELHQRGEDIRAELPAVLDMLVSDDIGRRSLGWAALTSAFPELAVKLSDYRFHESAETCRNKTERLRADADPVL